MLFLAKFLAAMSMHWFSDTDYAGARSRGSYVVVLILMQLQKLLLRKSTFSLLRNFILQKFGAIRYNMHTQWN